MAAQSADIEIGLLIYNAAFSAIGPFLETSLEDHLRELDTNCRTPLALGLTFGRPMAERRRGGILLMSSLSASQGSALLANYAATKAYNMILAEGLWDELREHGVAVLACCAGATATPNYLASLEAHPGGRAAPAMAPAAVVAEALAALGKQPSLVPGHANRRGSIRHASPAPRATAIRLMGRVTPRLISSRLCRPAPIAAAQSRSEPKLIPTGLGEIYIPAPFSGP